MVDSVAISPDGKCIVSGSFDGIVRVWDAETGKEFHSVFEGHRN
jgi:WD40 repeat protein